MAFRITLFNHKSGVSKTTTTFNLAWKLASLGERVLIVDADPQCNLSGLILGDKFDEYYTEERTKTSNIKDGVRAAFDARPEPINHVKCFSPDRNKNLFLLPGHADLSEYDAALSFAQNSNNAIATLQNLPGAFSKLIDKTVQENNISVVFIDMNPSLSAINQNLFVLSDAFIVPTNPDPFSIMAINTLIKVLPKWKNWAERVRPDFVNSVYPMRETTPKFLGTIIQRFNIRNGKVTKANENLIQQINTIVEQKLIPVLRNNDMLFDDSLYQELSSFCLASISDFQGLVPRAYEYGVPIYELTDKEIGVSGYQLDNMRASRDSFGKQFSDIVSQIQKFKANAESLPAV